MFVIYELVRGLPSFSDPEGALLLMAGDMGMLAAPVIFGWAIAAIPEVIARRRGGPRTRLRRNTLIAAWAFGLLMVVGWAAEQREGAGALTTAEKEAQAEMDARVSDFIARATSAPPSLPTPTPSARPEQHVPPSLPAPMPTARPEPSVPSSTEPTTADKPTSWVEIARQPDYVQASAAERVAIRDLYWRICIEALIPPAQRDSAREPFLRDWEIGESDVPPAVSRTMSVSEYLKQQKEGAPSPVSAGTMWKWCHG